METGAVATPSTGQSSHSDALPGRLLLVEDSPSDRRLITEMLVEAGVDRGRVTAAGSLDEARRSLTLHPVDCILLDLSLPDAAGLEGVSVMSAAAPDTPIVVVTGRTVDALVYAAMAEGADEYLCKAELDPLRLKDLLLRAAQRRRGSERHEQARRVASHVLDSLEAQTATLDGSGRIIAVNHAWAAAAAAAGADPAATGVGVNYLTVCEQAAGELAEGAAEAAAGVRAVLHGDTDRFAMDYWCPANGNDRWFSLRVTPMGELGGGAVVTHLDITDLKLAEQRLQHDQARLNSVFDESSPIFALVSPAGVVQHVSPTTTTLFGMRVGDALSATGFARVDQPDAARAHAAFDRVRTTVGAKEHILLRALDSAGRWHDLEIGIVNLLDDPAVQAVAVIGSDITEGRFNQIARRLESRLLQRLPAAVVVTDDRGVIVYWNDLAATVYGYSSEEAIGRSVGELSVGPTGFAPGSAIMQTVLQDGSWEGDYEVRRADGSIIPLHTVLERIDDDEINFHGIVGASVDISERHRLEQDLAFQALHDPLTGLPNRRLFVDHLENAIARAERGGRRTAVLFIDLDDFKSVNDRFGHAGGDEVLRSVGELVSAVVRAGDVVARLGGDEFVVCCEDLMDVAEAYAVTDRILNALGAPFRAGAETVVLSASVGMAVSGPSSPAGALLRNADAAMYSAKQAGKGRIEVFDDALHERARERHDLATDLRQALDAGDIEVYYQPQVAIDTGELEGFEALARWRHSQRGMVSPAEFVQVAEEVGLITRLGALVLNESCAALAAWMRANPERPISVAVNVSPRQLADPDFPATVQRAIEDAHVPAGRVCLEVTESALVDAGIAASALRKLKIIGVKIAIDDFGTGYSSLSRLHRFPVDFLKIDRSFVAGMIHQAEDAAIVSAVLGLARVLGVRTIAEGIEEQSQLAQLAAMGCNSGQGYLWSAATPPDAAMEVVISADPFPGLRPVAPRPLPAVPDVVPGTDTPRGTTDAATAIALLAHELAGSITVLAGHAELLTMTDNPAVRQNSVVAIERASRATRAALNVVRDVAALDAGSIKLNVAEVRISDVVAAALTLSDAFTVVGDLIDRPVEVDVPDVVVAADADRLVSIFVNLLSNATKHSPPGTVVRLRGEVDADKVVIHVLDDGPGVPVEHVGLIFRKFGRASQQQSGSGLGLYLARGLARAHGGDVFYRRVPTGGSDFAVELPRAGVAVLEEVQASSDTPVPVQTRTHEAVLYEHDDQIVDSISAWAAAAMGKGEQVLLVATEDHRRGVEADLLRRGFSLAAPYYQSRDAAQMLDSLMVNGEPSAAQFRAVVASFAGELAANRPLAVYGEMVNLLWQQNNLLGAMKLEQLWNDLIDEVSFGLLCGYQASAREANALEGVCRLHTAVSGPGAVAACRSTS